MAVHELIGEAGDEAAERQRPLIERYEDALKATLERRFEHAVEILSALPLEGPTAVLAARCRAWIAAPPSPNWDGTWTATTK